MGQRENHRREMLETARKIEQLVDVFEEQVEDALFSVWLTDEIADILGVSRTTFWRHRKIRLMTHRWGVLVRRLEALAPGA